MTASERIIFAAGDIFGGGGAALISVLYLFYLTDIIGIPPAWAGLALLIPKIWDAINDPLMGALSDNARTRWGRRRPFIGLGGSLLVLAIAAIWAPIGGWDSVGAKTAWAIGANLFYTTVSTMVAVPYGSLSTEVTTDYEERNRINVLRLAFSTVSAALCTLGGTTLLGWCSTQQYHPGHFGDQQHLWSLALPGDVAIFANHPGAPMFENNQRGFSPAEWVGNGINPALGQDENVLLACYDTRGRPGLLEHRPRRRQSHLFVQLDRLDQRRLDEDRLWVRAGDGCAQILTDGRMLVLPRDRHYQTLGNELMRNGRITAWAVVLGTEPCTDLDEFRSKNQGWQLRRRGGRLELTNEATATTWRLDRRRFTRNGEPLPVQHPRFDTPWVKAERFPTSIEINAGGHQLILDATGRRSES